MDSFMLALFDEARGLDAIGPDSRKAQSETPIAKISLRLFSFAPVFAMICGTQVLRGDPYASCPCLCGAVE